MPDDEETENAFRLIKRVLPGGSCSMAIPSTEQPVVDQLRPDCPATRIFRTIQARVRLGNDGRPSIQPCTRTDANLISSLTGGLAIPSRPVCIVPPTDGTSGGSIGQRERHDATRPGAC